MLKSFAQWLNDKRWAANMVRARRFRREVGFAARSRFDDAVRHPVNGGVIAYPDAIYHLEIDDLLRGIGAAYRQET